jgi:hypothetical protein
LLIHPKVGYQNHPSAGESILITRYNCYSETGESHMETNPHNYEILLKGSLDQRWAHRLEGMQISYLPDGNTLLTGALPDQAALYSNLTQLRDIGIPLLAVHQRDESE